MNFNSSKIRRLKSDINIINEEVFEMVNIDKICALILYGSYGRGEGAFFYENENIKPYNDYDILIISKKDIDQSKLHIIKKNLIEKIGINYIDLSVKSKSSLRKLKPNIFNFDLKYGSKVIWGDKGILNLIPEINKVNIGLTDVETLFFTRQFTFIGVLNYYNSESIIEDVEARFFRYQMAKAIFAVVDSILVDKNMYNTLYSERANLIINGNFSNEKFKDLVRWALIQKLEPSGEVISYYDFKQFYNDVKKIYFTELIRILSKYYWFEPVNYKMIIINKFLSLKEIYFAIKYILKNRSITKFLDSKNIMFSELIFNYLFDIKKPSSFKSNYFLNFFSNLKPKQNSNLWLDYKKRIEEMKFL